MDRETTLTTTSTIAFCMASIEKNLPVKTTTVPREIIHMQGVYYRACQGSLALLNKT